MAAAGTLGKGTTLAHGTTANGSFTTTGKVRGPNTKAAGKKVGSAETTCFDDTSEQFIPGFPGVTEGSSTFLYVTADYATLDGLVGTDLFWKFTLPDTHTVIVEGWIEELYPEIQLKEAIVCPCKFKFTGQPTYA